MTYLNDLIYFKHLKDSQVKLKQAKAKEEGEKNFSIIGHDFSFRTNRHFQGQPFIYTLPQLAFLQFFLGIKNIIARDFWLSPIFLSKQK